MNGSVLLRRLFRPALLHLFLVLLLLALGIRAEVWPGFRGPTGMGGSVATGLPLKWGGSDGKNVQWKASLPPVEAGGERDLNRSSPVVVGDTVVVTTDKAAAQPEHHVAAYDSATGKQLWNATVPPGPWRLTDLLGGYAAPTPAVADRRIFALFSSSILHALDLDGKLLWSFQLPDFDRFDVALSASPVVYNDNVLLLLDRKSPTASLMALDAVTGKVRWEKKRPDTDFGHMTPLLATVDGKPELLAAATHCLQGIDPASGEVIWFCNWDRPIWPVSSPVVANGLVYAIGGRGGHPGVVADPTGRGDVTATHLKWRIGSIAEGLSSPVAFGDLVFRLNSPGFLRCVRIESGDELFKERLPGVDPAVSPFVTADGRIYLASAGKSVVIHAGPELKILEESDLGDSSVAASRIFLKGKSFLYAVGEKKP